MSDAARTLAIVPARGGSDELKRKNLLPDAQGVPLVLAAARAARDADCLVRISTDDPEISSLAHIDGHFVSWRGGADLADLNNGPVDKVVERVVWADKWKGPVLLVQPTVQPMTADLLRWFLNVAEGGHPVFPDVDGHTPIALGVEDRHLIWATKFGLPQPDRYELLTDRIDRQADAEWPVREMGVRWWPSAADVQHPPAKVIAWPHPLVDIDTAADYQQITKRLTIQFLVAGSKVLGSGHTRRVLTLAEGLQHHDVAIAMYDGSDSYAYDLFYDRGWPAFIDTPDVFVYDALGERWPDEAHYDGTPTVGLEVTDSGYTAVINAMYDVDLPGHRWVGIYTGAKYAVLRPEFLIGDYQVQPEASRVLVLFGGTDPSNLTDLVGAAMLNDDEDGSRWDVDIIQPGDDRSIAAAMHDADLLITSGGRTVFEAAAVGIPTIVMCQNMRETTHTHLGVGNINLGLGRLVTPEQLRHVVTETLNDYELRRDMSATAKASIDGHGADRVRRIIEHVGLYGEAP